MPEFPFTNLVFEGGGVRGLAYIGALQAVEDAGIRPNVKAVAGTSAGAITAALVALGYTAEELGTTLTALNLTMFEDGALTGPLRVVTSFGFFRGDAFLRWMRDRVAERMGPGRDRATFAEVHAKTGMDLRIVVTNLSVHRAEVLSHETTPGMEMALGVRMSMSIPLFFAAVRDQQQTYVDGGAVWNYPLTIFDTGDEETEKRTLGFHLGLRGTAAPKPVKVGDIVTYGRMLYESLITVQTFLMEQNPDDVSRSVFIDHLGVFPTDFGIDAERKRALAAKGLEATNAYLADFLAQLP
jgi:NTE family protein